MLKITKIGFFQKIRDQTYQAYHLNLFCEIESFMKNFLNVVPVFPPHIRDMNIFLISS